MPEMEGGLPRAGEIVPGGADAIGDRPAQALPEGSASLVDLAIESVLEQVPDVGEAAPPEQSVKYQPWADTVALPAKNKRPLDELLAEYAARVEAAPDAVAPRPAGKPPGTTYFDRFGQPRRHPQDAPAEDARRRRRRRAGGRHRRRGGGGQR